MPTLGEHQQVVELVAGERGALGGALHLDELAGPGHHDVHVDLGPHVLRVVEVEVPERVDDTHRDRRALVGERVGGELLGGDEARAGVVQRDVAAADRRGAGAAVGLEHVAVDGDLHLAEHGEVGHRAERPADETLDLLRAARLLALRRLAVGALRRGAGQHRVLGRHPAPALAPQPRRHPLLHRRRAQHTGAAELDEHRARGELGEVTGEGDRAQLVGLAPVTSDSHWMLLSGPPGAESGGEGLRS